MTTEVKTVVITMKKKNMANMTTKDHQAVMN